MVKFLQYFANLFVRPHVALRALLGDPRRVVFGFLGPLILAAVYYIGISVALAMNAAHLPKLLLLNIPAEQYYSYERYFILPVGLAGTILASGVIRPGSSVVERTGPLRGPICSLWFQSDRGCCGDGPARPCNRLARRNRNPGSARL